MARGVYIFWDIYLYITSSTYICLCKMSCFAISVCQNCRSGCGYVRQNSSTGHPNVSCTKRGTEWYFSIIICPWFGFSWNWMQNHCHKIYLLNQREATSIWLKNVTGSSSFSHCLQNNTISPSMAIAYGHTQKQKDKTRFMANMRYFLDTRATMKTFWKLMGTHRYKYTVESI